MAEKSRPSQTSSTAPRPSKPAVRTSLKSPLREGGRGGL